MKNVINFIVWQWTKWQVWQRIYAIAMILVIIGFLLPGIIGAFLLVVGLTSLLSWMFKWAVWDSITNAYKEFKKEHGDE
jgi:type IV secretory pathway TrbL component